MPGFRSLDTEVSDRKLPVEGSIPEWLSGTLIRNGPGKFEIGGRRLQHWFDGLAMLRKYAFADGEVRYSNRFLRTETYEEAMAGRISAQFSTDVGGIETLRRWVKNLGPPEPTDNANVHVARIDGEYVAQTEAPRWVGFDGTTLESTGEFEFDDLFDPHVVTAHLVEDPASGDLFGHAITFGRTHEYHLFRIPDGTRRREIIASIPTGKPAYVHSVGVSEQHLVLVETPLRIDIVQALSPFNDGFFDLLDWQTDAERRLYVVERETGSVVTSPTVEPFFTFHVTNAYDDGETVVLDLVAFEDDTIVEALSLGAVTTGGFEDVPPGRLTRFRITPDGEVTVRRLYTGGTELPAVADTYRTRPYRYVYGQATDREGANGLVKVDVERDTCREWWEGGLYVEEPCPVRRPGATAEDDGVVLVTALDVESERSVLLVFDAATLEERARAKLPHHNPFGFHGRFFEADADD